MLLTALFRVFPGKNENMWVLLDLFDICNVKLQANLLDPEDDM